MNNLNFVVKYCPKCLELFPCDNNFNWNTCTNCKTGLLRHQKLIEIMPHKTKEEYDKERYEIHRTYNSDIYETRFIWLYETLLKDSSEYNNSNFEKDLNRFRDRDQKMNAANRERNLTAIRCPNCDSICTEKISTTKKVTSTAVLGLASRTIGKNYKCKNCGYIW